MKFNPLIVQLCMLVSFLLLGWVIAGPDFVAARWWVTRDNCGIWYSWMVGVYMLANFWIWVSYERIPYELAKLSKQGIHVFSEKNSRYFIYFIQFCGRGICWRMSWCSFGLITCSLPVGT